MHFYLKMVGAVTFAMANAVSPVSIAAQDAAPPSLLAREKAATTDVLKVFDGIWVGTAEAVAPDGTTHRFEQMERIGPMLAGEIRVMEGKARDPKGKTLHNAFTVFSVTKDGIEMRSWTPGRAGSRIIELTKEGYNWRTSIGGLGDHGLQDLDSGRSLERDWRASSARQGTRSCIPDDPSPLERHRLAACQLGFCG